MRCAPRTALRLLVARVALRGWVVPAAALLQDAGTDCPLTPPSADSDSADGDRPRLPVVSGTGGRGDYAYGSASTPGAGEEREMTNWLKARSAFSVQLGVLVVSGVLLLPRLAGATTVIAHSFASLVQQAEVIAVGTVTAIESEWDAEHAAPWTLVTFADLEVLKGDANQTALTLHILGGPTPDGPILRIAGVPQFRLGDRRVIFCAGNQQYAVPLVGMWQGVYRVGFDPERGVETVHNHAGQPVTRLPTEAGGILHHGAARHQESDEPPSAAMPLATFTQLIEQELGNGQ